MIPSLNEAEVWTPKNTKRDYRNVAPEKIIKSIGDDQKSSCIMNHWGKNDRNHENQDSNDSASTPEINWSFSMRLCRNKLNILHLFSYSVMSSLFSIINWTKKFWQTFFLFVTRKVRGQDNSFFESSRFKYTNQRHATIFFVKKKNCSKEQGKRERQKESWKKVPFVKILGVFPPSYVRFLEVFFSHFITKILPKIR